MPYRIPQALQNLVQQEANRALPIPQIGENFIPPDNFHNPWSVDPTEERGGLFPSTVSAYGISAPMVPGMERMPLDESHLPGFIAQQGPGGLNDLEAWIRAGGTVGPADEGGVWLPPPEQAPAQAPPQVAQAPPQVTQDHPTPNPRMAWVQELKPRNYKEEQFKQRDPEAWRKMAENRRDSELSRIQERESGVSRIRELIASGKLTESTGEAQIRDLENNLTPGEMTKDEREDANRQRFDSVRAREDVAEKRRQEKIASRQEQAAQGQVPMNMMTMASAFIALGFPADEAFRFAGLLANEGRAEQAAIIVQARENREAAESALKQKEMEIRLEYLPESSELAIEAKKQDIKQGKERHEAYLKDLKRQAKDAKQLAEWRREDTDWKKQQAVIDNKLAQERIDMQRKQYEQAAADTKAAKETAYHESIKQAFNKQLEAYTTVGLTELVYYSYKFDENGNKRTREQVDQKMEEGGADQLSLKQQMIVATEAQTIGALQWTLINTPGTAVNKLWQKMKTAGVDTSLMGLPDSINDDQNIWMQSPEHKNMFQSISPGASPVRPKAGDAGFIDRLRGESGIA